MFSKRPRWTLEPFDSAGSSSWPKRFMSHDRPHPGSIVPQEMNTRYQESRKKSKQGPYFGWAWFNRRVSGLGEYVCTLCWFPPQTGVAKNKVIQLLNFPYRPCVVFPSHDAAVSTANKGLKSVSKRRFMEREDKTDTLFGLSMRSRSLHQGCLDDICYLIKRGSRCMIGWCWYATLVGSKPLTEWPSDSTLKK